MSKDYIETLKGCTRVEVIDETGRVYTRWSIKDVHISHQDSGRTLKVFVSGVDEHD